MVFDADVRQSMLPGTRDRQLALALDLADRVAQREGQAYWGWEGYTDPAVRTFVSDQLHGG